MVDDLFKAAVFDIVAAELLLDAVDRIPTELSSLHPVDLSIGLSSSDSVSVPPNLSRLNPILVLGLEGRGALSLSKAIDRFVRDEVDGG